MVFGWNSKSDRIRRMRDMPEDRRARACLTWRSPRRVIFTTPLTSISAPPSHRLHMQQDDYFALSLAGKDLSFCSESISSAGCELPGEPDLNVRPAVPVTL